METGFELMKYPRTPHLAGSRLQPGDEDLSQAAFSQIRGRYLVIEEKIDGVDRPIVPNGLSVPIESLFDPFPSEM